MTESVLKLDLSLYHPLPPYLWGGPCNCCQRLGARWYETSAAQDDTYPLVICSLCILYATPWGKEHRKILDSVLGSYVLTAKKMLATSTDGELIRMEDGDRILTVAVMAGLIGTMIQETLKEKHNECSHSRD